MSLTINAIPIFLDNYAWALHDTTTSKTAIIDPGEADPIRTYLDTHGHKLDFILLTHHHADHINGADTLRQHYGARILGPRDQRLQSLVDENLQEGDLLSLGESHGHVLATPGHTLSHLCYYFSNPSALFCGDTLFSLGCGRLFEGTAEQLFESFLKIIALPPQTWICCGHEYTLANADFAFHVDPTNHALKERITQVRSLRSKGQPTLPSTLEQELATNPFLRAPNAQILKHLRQEKDTF
ncbi:MAG: hydroxyacylglutathione hydrolase [Acetobacter sp.]|nr:hydroxyacylglutathione hydrolase [Acetobacter sp.]